VRIAVFGLGLLGGSVCKALRTADGNGHISAYDIDRSSLEDARRNGVIDDIIETQEAVIHCDVAVIALPVKSSISAIRAVLDSTDDSAMVVDLGSVKTGVINGVIDHRNSSRFVPCHPMAGSERSGFAGSSPDILSGANVIITPHIKNTPDIISRAVKFWEMTGMKVTIADCTDHDVAVAYTSHLPHLLSAALVCAEKKGLPSDMSNEPFRGRGFRDMTRLASGSPAVWEDICEMNAAQIVKAIDTMTGILCDLRRELAENPVDGKALREFLEEAVRLKKEY